MPELNWHALFSGIAGMQFGWILAGVIWSLALGFAAGNYACSLVHRLPRGKSILENKPYCGECGHPLATADLFPVVSALMLKHRCRYCGVKIPMSHFWTEILVGALFVLCFLRFNFSEMYLLVAAIGVFLIILSCIELNEGKMQRSVLVVLAVLGIVYRTLVDMELSGAFFGGLYGLLFGAAAWCKGIRKAGHLYVLPAPAQVFAVVGIIAGQNQVFYVLPAALVLALLRVPVSVAVALPLVAAMFVL